MNNDEPIIDIIENTILPNALMMGVTYNEFWELNPKSLSPFIKAFFLKQEVVNQHLWSLGNYFRIAVGSLFDKQCTYPSSPPKLTQPKDEYAEMRRIQANFEKHAIMINKSYKKG